jgi:uncharacterized protein (DUF2236 family)
VSAIETHRAAVRARLQARGIPRSGPGSISWTVNREMVVVAGWGRAILLQLAHPAIAAGLHQHSTFRGSLGAGLRRMRSTIASMLAITFGDTGDLVDTAARINAIHDRVRGEGYSAHDPELQRWVHATLLDSIPLVYERLVGPLGAAERDQYCREAIIMEPVLGMPAGTLPRTAAALDTYMREMLAGGSLVVTNRARALARAVLYPPRWYAAWPAFRPVQLLTIGTLPPAIREAYGFAWRSRDEGALRRWTTALRFTLRALPGAARHWPAARAPRAGAAAGRTIAAERSRA